MQHLAGGGGQVEEPGHQRLSLAKAEAIALLAGARAAAALLAAGVARLAGALS